MNNHFNKFIEIYIKHKKEIVLNILIVVYYLKRPLYFKVKLGKYTYLILNIFFFIHAVTIYIHYFLRGYHIMAYIDYIIGIIDEIYSVIILKKPSWKSENI